METDTLTCNKLVVTNGYNKKFRKVLGYELNILIKKYDLILSGSAVVAILLGDFYPGSDFDIYTMIPFKMRNENEIESPFDDEVVSIFGGVLMLSTPYKNFGKINYKYICPNFTINIINVSVNCKFEIYDHISNSTDIDICSSTYDGTIVKFPSGLLKRKAKSVNYDLINEYDNFQIEQGISIEEFAQEQERLKLIFIRKRKTRVIKYINRGIDIDTDLDISDHDKYLASIFTFKQDESEYTIRNCLRALACFTKENVDSGGNYVLKNDKTSTIIERLQKNEEIICEYNTFDTNRLDYVALRWVKKWI